MKIIIDQAEIMELITTRVSPIIGDAAFEIILIPADGDIPMSAEIVITTNTPNTVASVIARHVGPEVKKEIESTKKTRRNRKQMIRDGDAKNVTTAEQAEVDAEIETEKKLKFDTKTEESSEEKITGAGKPDAGIMGIKTGLDEQTDTESTKEELLNKKEETVMNTAGNVDSLFNN